MIYIKDNFLDTELLNSLNENFLFDFEEIQRPGCTIYACLLYTSDAADDMESVELGGRRLS